MVLKTARKILLCLRYGIGDLVMELPALEALRREAPEAWITALGAEPALQLLKEDRRVDELVNVLDFGYAHWGDFGTPPIREKVNRWLERERFDLVLDASHAVLGMAEAILAHTGSILDSGSDAPEEALRQGWGGQEAVCAAVRARWGIAVPLRAPPSLRPDRRDVAFADDFLRRHGAGAGNLVGVSPVASSPLKCWPLERFASLIDRLAERDVGRVLLFHGPQREEAEVLLKRICAPERVVPVGNFDLRRIAALLARATLFIGQDTGLMHMAAAVGVPLVALFGPTSPAIYLPRQVPSLALGGDRPCPWRRTASFGPPACVMQGHCLEGERSCIDCISPEQVWAALQDFLSPPGPRQGDGKAGSHPPPDSLGGTA